MHRYLADRQAQPPSLPPPPQVMKAGDEYATMVRVVFANSGEQVPWDVNYVNCPEGYLMRFKDKKSHGKGRVREDGDFRVEWDD